MNAINSRSLDGRVTVIWNVDTVAAQMFTESQTCRRTGALLTVSACFPMHGERQGSETVDTSTEKASGRSCSNESTVTAKHYEIRNAKNNISKHQHMS